MEPHLEHVILVGHQVGHYVGELVQGKEVRHHVVVGIPPVPGLHDELVCALYPCDGAGPGHPHRGQRHLLHRRRSGEAGVLAERGAVGGTCWQGDGQQRRRGPQHPRPSGQPRLIPRSPPRPMPEEWVAAAVTCSVQANFPRPCAPAGGLPPTASCTPRSGGPDGAAAGPPGRAGAGFCPIHAADQASWLKGPLPPTD